MMKNRSSNRRSSKGSKPNLKQSNSNSNGLVIKESTPSDASVEIQPITSVIEQTPEIRQKIKKNRRCSKKRILLFLMFCPIILTFLFTTFSSSHQEPLIRTLNGGALTILHDFRCKMSTQWLPPQIQGIFNSSLAQIENALSNLNNALSVSSDRPGILFSQSNSFAEIKFFPVTMIPGVVSGGLELWRGKPCAAPFFRDRVWGSTSMIQLMVTQPMCWISHLSLLPDGSDPEGIKVRPVHGLTAADFLFPGYWVWAPLIENFADLGYDSSTLETGSYDWRLPLTLIESRDHSFSKWMNSIELRKRFTGDKTVLISHSYGAQVTFFFLQWAESVGGVGWVNSHIRSWINIGGPLLGAAKAVGTYISGEMRDTAQLHPLIALALDKFVAPSARLSLLRSWSSGVAMFPKGQDQIWGSEALGAPEDADDQCQNHTLGGVMHLRTVDEEGNNVTRSLTAGEALDLLKRIAGPEFSRVVDEMHSFGVDPDAAFHPERWANTPRKWTNVLEAPLPRAPDMTVYCLYGTGKATERRFHYADAPPQAAEATELPDGRMGPTIPYQLDTGVSRPEVGLRAGVQEGDGDGTVPLLSMGYMCYDGWRNYPGLNPSGVRTVIREYPHLPASVVVHPRGVPTTADHVDIMGNYELIADILAIVADTPVEERILSQLPQFAAKIQLKPTEYY